ncbi:MAG: FliM/FliN family flagellar motor switch protein [Hyphomonas sp.]
MTLLPNENLDDGWDVAPGLQEDVVVDMPTTFEEMAPERPIPSGRGVLSADEIQALLRPDLSDMDDAEHADDVIAEPEAVAPVQLQDHATPVAQSAPADPDGSEARATDLLASLQRIAARLSLALRQSSGLRAAVTVRDVAAEQFDVSVSSLSQDRGRAYACFTDDSGEVVAMLCISGLLAGRMIEGACGGASAHSPLSRLLTPIDIALLEALVRPIGQAIAPGLTFARIEIDYEFAASLVGPIDACAVDLSLRLRDETLPARLIMCETLLLPELIGSSHKAPAPAQAIAAPEPEVTAPSEAPKQSEPIGVTAIMTARVASLSVPLSRLADLKPGSTLLLGVPADQPVSLLSGGRDGALVAEGKIGRKGNKIALCISSRGPLLRRG